MAGDWIKVEHATTDKPEVLRIADLLGVSRREALGTLLDFWVWLDRNCRNADSVTTVTHMSRKSIDEVTRCPGFAACLIDVGWAEIDESTGVLTIRNGDRHNGNSAKTRALGKDRAAASRSRESNAECVTREEKRRDISTSLRSVESPQRATRLPKEWEPTPEDLSFAKAERPEWDTKHLRSVVDGFRDYWIAVPGAKGCKLDWPATWRRWVRDQRAQAPPRRADRLAATREAMFGNAAREIEDARRIDSSIDGTAVRVD